MQVGVTLEILRGQRNKYQIDQRRGPFGGPAPSKPVETSVWSVGVRDVRR